MNWWQVLGSIAVSALLAAVALGLAPARQRGVALVLAVLAGIPFHEAAGNALEDLFAPAGSPAGAIAREYGRKAARFAPLQKALAGKSQAEADALVAGYTEAGLCTLPDELLDHRALILSLLVNQPDDTLAAGLFTGQADGGRLLAALDKLPRAEIEAWYAIHYTAAVGAFGDRGKVPTELEQKKAIRKLVAATQLDGTRLLEAFMDPHPKPADAAWAARKVYRTLAGLPRAERLEVERTLAAPKSGFTTR